MAELKAKKLRKVPYFLIPLLDSAIFRTYTPNVNIVAEHTSKERYADLLYLPECQGRIEYKLRKEPNGGSELIVGVDYLDWSERAVEESIAERSMLPLYLYLMNPLFKVEMKESEVLGYLLENEFIVDLKERSEFEWLKQVAKVKAKKGSIEEGKVKELERIIESVKERKGSALEKAEKQQGNLRKVRETNATELGLSAEETAQMKTDDEAFRKAIVERLKRLSLLNLFLLSRLVRLALKKL